MRSMHNTPELTEFIEEGYEDAPEELAEEEATENGSVKTSKSVSRGKKGQSDDVTDDKEGQHLSAGKQSKRISNLSMSDVADRHLRDKTDAIAHIIKNISDQCAAAVEGLNLALDAEDEEESANKRNSNLAPSDDGRAHSVRSDGSEMGGDDSLLSPDNGNSSLPPTPDLIHNRSSTSMSMMSSSTAAERSSQQYSPGELPTKIVEDDDEYAHETEMIDDSRSPSGKMSKKASQDIMRPNTTRMVM